MGEKWREKGKYGETELVGRGKVFNTSKQPFSPARGTI